MRHPPDELFEVEARIAMRKAHLQQTARETKAMFVRKLVSPAGLIGAAVLGFVAASVLTRPKKVVAQEPGVKKGKLAGLASLAMTAGMWYLRSRFGNPTALANFVLAKIKREPDAAAPAYDAAPPPSLRGDSEARQRRPAQMPR